MSDFQAHKDKVNQFLDGFDTEALFLDWCRAQSIQAFPDDSASCLVAKAIKTATGLEQISIRKADDDDGGYWWCEVDNQLGNDLPMVLQRVPSAFDALELPEFIHPDDPAHPNYDDAD